MNTKEHVLSFNVLLLLCFFMLPTLSHYSFPFCGYLCHLLIEQCDNTRLLLLRIIMENYRHKNRIKINFVVLARNFIKNFVNFKLLNKYNLPIYCVTWLSGYLGAVWGSSRLCIAGLFTRFVVMYDGCWFCYNKFKLKKL